MKLPLVVIVGRPNVGKSTLFNRLTKSTTAIVDDFSGVTRDRNYGEVEWNGKLFRIIDTGGYVPNSADLFEKAIKEQITIAVDEAEAILFLVVGKAGVTPIDREIAGILRKSSKLAYILVNKIDMQSAALNAADFYSLGLGNLYDVSALNGRNLGDFLDDIMAELSFADDYLEKDENLKIAIVGKPNVGKSSLVNSLLGFERSIVTDIPGTTRDSLDSTLKYYGEDITLVDTAGLRKKARVTENIEFFSTVRTYRAIWDADVAILLIDAVIGIDKQDQKILDEIIRRRKGVIIAVNKWDLVEEKETNTAKFYEEEAKKKLGNVDYAPVIFISALTKQRIYKLIDIAKTVDQERKKKIATSELNDVLLPEIVRVPPPSSPTGKEVKIKYITQVGDYYPIFLFFTNEPRFIPDNYKRYLEKLIRAKFGFQGVPITLSFRDK